MNLKILEKEIKKALDNLENVKVSNTIKAQSIVEAISPILEEMNGIKKYNFSVAKRSKHASN